MRQAHALIDPGDILPGPRYGLGHHALALGLAHLAAGNVGGDVLVTVSDSKRGSARTIERAGGLLESEIPHAETSGGETCRYWIRLDGQPGQGTPR